MAREIDILDYSLRIQLTEIRRSMFIGDEGSYFINDISIMDVTTDRLQLFTAIINKLIAESPRYEWSSVRDPLARGLLIKWKLKSESKDEKTMNEELIEEAFNKRTSWYQTSDMDAEKSHMAADWINAENRLSSEGYEEYTRRWRLWLRGRMEDEKNGRSV